MIQLDVEQFGILEHNRLYAYLDAHVAEGVGPESISPPTESPFVFDADEQHLRELIDGWAPELDAAAVAFASLQTGIQLKGSTPNQVRTVVAATKKDKEILSQIMSTVEEDSYTKKVNRDVKLLRAKRLLAPAHFKFFKSQGLLTFV